MTVMTGILQAGMQDGQATITTIKTSTMTK